jgi:hypothetical protein
MKAQLAYVRKLLVYVLGVVAQLLALGVLHGDAQNIAVGVIALATGLGIYQAKNEPIPSRVTTEV